MKIKNMKMMLLGLIGLMSVSTANAEEARTRTVDGITYTVVEQALDETGRSVNGIVYDLRTITWEDGNHTKSYTQEATVTSVNAQATAAEVATLSIPAEVTGDKGTYKVTFIAENWYAKAGMKDVKALTKNLSIDVTNLEPTTVTVGEEEVNNALDPNFYKGFTKLESLTITDSNTAKKAVITMFIGGFVSTEEVPGTKTTLTTVDFTDSNISEIGDNAFEGFTALTGFDFTGIEKIGASAFKGDYGFTTLTIPATVTAIGKDAFANMYYKKDENTAAVGLTTLTISGANNAYNAQGALTNSEIPAAFSGNGLLSTLTISSTTAISIKADAFKNDAALTSIDLSGATALGGKIGETQGSIGEGAFPTGCKLTSVKWNGTKMANTIFTDINLTASHQTLATLTLPAELSELNEKQFQDFVALTAIDLSETKVTEIPAKAFEITGTEKDDKGKVIAPALASVKLNAETKIVKQKAFRGQSALTTIEGLNQAKLEKIEWYAFQGTGLTAIDLSNATNAAFTTIYTGTFADMNSLATITLPAQITDIYTGAFAYDKNVTSINLEALEGLTVLNPIFHEGVVGETVMEGIGITPEEGGDPHVEVIEVPNGVKEVGIKLATLTLPENLETITDGALQLLDIAEIEIPATVTVMGSRALQGCIKLKKFTWNGAQQRTLTTSTFLGDDKLEEVKMVTSDGVDNYNPIQIQDDGQPQSNAIDKIFMGNKKNVLTFTVNSEDLAVLQANGWTEANLQFCTLSSEGASEFAFKENAKAGEYYYATYYNENQATWFPAEDFEVFAAVVEGSEVVLKAATVEEGYYKVAKYSTYDEGDNRKDAVCVIRSKSQKANYELKNAGFNDISTMPTDNGLKISDGFAASRLKYQYKLGIKGGKVAFYRITSGTFGEGVVYIDAEDPKDRLDIVFDGEATAIKDIKAAAESKAPIYNLSGMRVNKASKGVYIQDGKKYVVK